MPDQIGALPLSANGSGDVVIGNRSAPAVARLRLGVVLAVLAFFFLVIPGLNSAGVVPDYKVQQLGRYLCFALVAIGADLIWGYTGLLSLCQALFFCLGGYAFAMHLSLPEGGGIYEVPQFLTYVYYGHANPIPPFWRPFSSGIMAVVIGLAVAGTLAALFGFFIFRSRVRGVYFSIITQAVAWGTWLLICQNELLLGGTNGLTNFSKSFTEDRGWIIKLYLLTLVCVVGGYLLCRAVVRSRAGRVMVAIRDKEMRLFFTGYKPFAFKVFAFTIAALVGAVGGMLYAPQMGIITPQNMNVTASIEVVILVAVGGRGRLWGAIFGAVLVKTLGSTLSSDLPAVWPFIYGGMFVAVVLFFPAGFVGLWDQIEEAVATRQGVGQAVAAGISIAAAVAFALGENLGVIPNALQQEFVFSIPFGKLLLVALVLIAFCGWMVRSMMRSDLSANAAYALAVAAGVITLGIIGTEAMKYHDPLMLELRWKYILLVAVLVAAVIVSVKSRMGARSASNETDIGLLPKGKVPAGTIR